MCTRCAVLSRDLKKEKLLPVVSKSLACCIPHHIHRRFKVCVVYSVIKNLTRSGNILRDFFFSFFFFHQEIVLLFSSSQFFRDLFRYHGQKRNFYSEKYMCISSTVNRYTSFVACMHRLLRASGFVTTNTGVRRVVGVKNVSENLCVLFFYWAKPLEEYCTVNRT